jgi:hypothetical protein
MLNFFVPVLVFWPVGWAFPGRRRIVLCHRQERKGRPNGFLRIQFISSPKGVNNGVDFKLSVVLSPGHSKSVRIAAYNNSYKLHCNLYGI